ncbi:hypothetical protein GH714_003189 [Hevea brasiliensis]|uniref:Tf2-1-like SH3-like domain-containing protein n=1 Tax=Hevea brasiliensis TaxID=3981 RepID=A0A6A6NBH6_HEVBR|nr:hypothetical protein GH714_003189 [Hevea brasiliensis]
MEYKPGKANLVADALIQKVELAATATQPTPGLLELISEGLQHDSQARLIRELVAQGKTRRFWEDDQGLLRTKRGSVFVPSETGPSYWMWRSFPTICKRVRRREQVPLRLPRDSSHSPHMVAIPYRGPNPAAFRFAKQWKEQVELAKTSLARATKKMKKWADSKRRHLEFEEGDLVLVRLFQRTHGKRHKGLLRKYEGPFPIEKRIGKVAYRVKLPAQLECHPVFHISLLKPYYADHEDPTRNKSKRAPVAMTSSLEHEPEE